MKISREKIALVVTDFLALNLAYISSYALRYKTGWFYEVTIAPEFRHLWIPSLVVSSGWMVIYLLRGMYRTLYGQGTVDILFDVAKASVVGVFIIFLITIDLLHGDRRAKDDLIATDLGGIDDVRIGYLLLKLSDSPFHQHQVFPGGVVFRILSEVSLLTRELHRLLLLGASQLQVPEFLLQIVETLSGHGY